MNIAAPETDLLIRSGFFLKEKDSTIDILLLGVCSSGICVVESTRYKIEFNSQENETGGQYNDRNEKKRSINRL